MDFGRYMINNTQSMICDMIREILKVHAEFVFHPDEFHIFTNREKAQGILLPLKESVCAFLRDTERQGGFQPGCQYCFHTSLRLSLMILPFWEGTAEKMKNHLVIGPYLTEDFSEQLFSHICSSHAIPPSMAGAWRALYTTLPVVMESQVERAAGVAARYLSCCKEIARELLELKLDHVFSGKSGPTESFQLASDVLEERYLKENRLLAAVREGDERLAISLTRDLKGINILPRPKDAVRSIKNIMLSTNTLLRKTVEQCSVHPVYLDRISRKQALEIENCMSLRQLDGTGENMVRGYCRLVKNYSLSRFSRPVQKAINYIRLNLTLDLSLKMVAAHVELAPSYLSGLFKKETGCRMTAYIHEKRIEHAARLLSRTSMPVSEAAARAGFSDASYFAYLFKRSMGRTPTQYRLQG